MNHTQLTHILDWSTYPRLDYLPTAPPDMWLRHFTATPRAGSERDSAGECDRVAECRRASTCSLETCALWGCDEVRAAEPNVYVGAQKLPVDTVKTCKFRSEGPTDASSQVTLGCRK